MRPTFAAGALMVAVLLGSMTAAAAQATDPASSAPPGETAPRAATESDGKVVEVRKGVATLQALLETKTVTQEHGTYVLHQPVVVLAGASLELSNVELRLSGGPEPASLRVSGTLTATSVTFSGGHGPRAERAEIAVSDGGSLRLTSSVVDGLGSSTDHPGVIVRGPGSGATIIGTTMQRNVRGIEAVGAGRVLLRHANVRRNLESGVVIHDSCESAVIVDTVVSQNIADGLAFDTTCTNVSVIGGSANRNGGSGLDAAGSSTVDIEGLAAWGNGSGITSQDSAVVAVSGAALSANRLDGITMNATSGTLSVAQSRIDHNIRAGISISSGTTTVGPGNVINANDVGVRLVSGASSVSAAGNTVEHNVRDGFSVASVTGITIRDNRIVNNGDAAFSVAQTGDAERFLGINTLSASSPPERTRAQDSSDAQ